MIQAAPTASFTYTYDFGDAWEHEIMVETVEPAVPDVTLPACIGGRRAAPPEDCGGPWGYAELLAALADPSHPEHAQLTEWTIGMGRDPNAPDTFDPDEFAGNLESVRHGRFGG